ncbi:MAG: coproporphyrinogen dehydrogenase HemZ [Lachnospiraceae bacterium]|nr:coproporphyrinogen dehydrogenase HemZ [Lachnospiraceae bacterium]
MENKTYVYIEPEKYLMDVLALLRSFYAEKDIKPVIPESREDVKAEAKKAGFFFSIRIMEDGKADFSFAGKNHSFTPETSNPDDFTAYKKELCRCLYGIFKEDTGRELPWGMMNGVRPTKPAFVCAFEGRGRHEAEEYYRSEYLVSDDKITSSWDIAVTELNVLSQCEHRELSVPGDVRGYTGGYSLYIGIPFCPTRCLYCSFTAYPLSSVKDGGNAYVQALISEMKECGDIFPGRAPDSIYMGGGTPTSLSASQLDRIISVAEDVYFAGPNIEFTVEAGRADSITEDKLRILKKHGISRISVNPQTFNQKTLDLIGRKATADETVRAFELARDLGFDNVNMDIILGLPGEGADEVKHTMEVISQLKPDSLTVHSLALKRASAMGEWLEKNGHSAIVNTDEIQEIARAGAESIGLKPYYLYRQKDMSGGFENVGYSVPGKECVYNVAMMEEVQSILGFGAGTITKKVTASGTSVNAGTHELSQRSLGELLSGGGSMHLDIERCENYKDVKDYTERVSDLSRRKKELFEHVC